MHALLRVVDRMMAVDAGRKLIEGDPETVMASNEVRSVYLGDDLAVTCERLAARRSTKLDVGYGDFQALFGIDLHVAEAETVSIIGANGAGKSTLLKSIVGLVQPMRGDIRYDGVSIASTPRPQARRAGHRRWCPRAGESSRR